jgi:hypothetical protein
MAICAQYTFIYLCLSIFKLVLFFLIINNRLVIELYNIFMQDNIGDT